MEFDSADIEMLMSGWNTLNHSDECNAHGNIRVVIRRDFNINSPRLEGNAANSIPKSGFSPYQLTGSGKIIEDFLD
jgi:hypothetical protein